MHFADSLILESHGPRSSGFPEEGTVFDYFPGAGNKPLGSNGLAESHAWLIRLRAVTGK